MTDPYISINATIIDSSGSPSLDTLTPDCDVSVVVVENKIASTIDDVVVVARDGASRMGTIVAWETKSLDEHEKITCAVDDDVDCVDVYRGASIGLDGTVSGTFVGTFTIEHTYRTLTVTEDRGALGGSLANVYVSTSGTFSVVNSTEGDLEVVAGDFAATLSRGATSPPIPADGVDSISVSTDLQAPLTVAVYDTTKNTATISVPGADLTAEQMLMLAQPYVVTPNPSGEVTIVNRSGHPVKTYFLGNANLPQLTCPNATLSASEAPYNWYAKWEIDTDILPDDAGDGWTDPKIIVKRPVTLGS
ncbi:MAG: hypothetical protein K0V04_10305 [Deltaproteobacteria bacterium]|nr:hypothetical protein [Deltaproteobacteria bacterium]